MRILITAGPTREHIDPIRFLSNCSTGFFGYQIARESVRRGHKTVLISGPTCLRPPNGIKLVSVVSAGEMKKAVERFFPRADCLIMTAAVADYRPVKTFSKKIKKGAKRITLRLEANPDILLTVAKKKKNHIVIGFALETEDLNRNVQKKLEAKNLDYIIATSIKRGESPFGDRKIRAVIMARSGKKEIIFSSKKRLSRIILDKAETAKYPYKGIEFSKKGGE